MRNIVVADRYARALGEAVKDPGQMEAAAAALNAISSLYTTDASFRHALANPTLALESRARVLDIAVKAVAAPEVVGRLLHAVLRRNRMGLLPEIATQFEHHIDGWLNRVEVTVTSATPLTPPLETRLMRSLQTFTNRAVRLKCNVDPGITGGIMVHLWGVLFDFSLRTRIEGLKRKLLAEEIVSDGYQGSRQ